MRVINIIKDKYAENKNYIQELSTLINALDAKIQMEPMSIFIQTYEERYFVRILFN